MAQAIDFNRLVATAYYNRANAYARQREHPAALADYAKAIELEPALAAAYYIRGNSRNST